MNSPHNDSTGLNSSAEPPLSSHLRHALKDVQHLLLEFSQGEDFLDKMRMAFGTEFDLAQAETLIDQITAGELPWTLSLVPGSAINHARGAFAAETNTIYLSHELVTEEANSTLITDVVLEEMGHFFDANVNTVDSPGDEGAIFSALVQNNDLDDSALQALYVEDDRVVIELDGQTIELEQAVAGINPAFDLIGLTQMRNDPRFAGIDGSGFNVAVIDTGLDASHPLIQPNFTAFDDFVYGRTVPYDLDSHGTHVAGIVGARNENIGVAPDVGLIGLQVFTEIPGRSRPGAYLPDQVEALNWVLQNHQQYNIVAVNMSLGSGFYTSEAEVPYNPTLRLIDQLEQAGVTVVVAAGNEYQFRDNPLNTIPNEAPNLAAPAIYGTLAVGAVWQDSEALGWYSGQQLAGADRLTVFSQRLDAPNMLFAPGALINSTVPRGGFERFPGTSMAAPHVAGVVALMQEAASQFGGRRLAPSEIVSILRSTADIIFDGDDEQDVVENTNIFYPRINVFRAIEAIYDQFQQIGGGSGDPNGTIQGAFLGPRLTGAPVTPVFGSIGIDGGTVPVGDTDVDIIRFEVLAPGTVTLEVASNSNAPQDFDSILRLFDQNGTQLAFSDDDGVGLFSEIETFLNPGIYYAGVSGFGNANYNPNIAGSGVSGATGNFELRFSLNNADPNGLINGATDVFLRSSRDPLTFDGLIGADYGAPVGVADVDLFRIEVPDNGTLLIDIDTPYETGFVDSFLRLFDENGNELFFPTGTPFESDDTLSFDRVGNPTEFTDARFPNLTFSDPVDRSFFQGHTTDSFLGALVERGSVYYIGVSDFFNQDYNPNNLDSRLDAGAGGRYQITVDFVNNDLNGSIDQAISTAALPIVNQPGLIGFDGDPLTGNILEVGDKDVDFVKINSPISGILEIDIDSYADPSLLPSGNPVDTVVLVFDGSGNLLAVNDDSDSLDPLLQLPISAGMDYYVAVTGYGNDNFDPFALGSGSSGDTGEYIFNSRILPAGSAVLLTDNTLGNGAVVNVSSGTDLFGNIGSDGTFAVGAADIDFYRFTTNTSRVVDVRVSNRTTVSPGSTGADTFLRVFDAAGNEIVFNDNESSSTRGSFAQFWANAGQVYYLGVNGFSSQARRYDPLTGSGAADGSQGNYFLSIAAGSSLGNDDLVGTADDDSIFGRSGDDRLSGQAGNDSLYGGAGNDMLLGGTGNDVLFGRDGDDTLYGQDGSDRLIGGSGNDVLLGGDGSDRLIGRSGSDRLSGSTGDDWLYGGSGNDILLGGLGNDRLVGGAGNDMLNGGSGNNRLIGWSGRDIFVISRGGSRDLVLDFQDGIDRIGLAGRLSFSNLTIVDAGRNTVIRDARSPLLMLLGVDANDIDHRDFVAS